DAMPLDEVVARTDAAAAPAPEATTDVEVVLPVTRSDDVAPRRAKGSTIARRAAIATLAIALGGAAVVAVRRSRSASASPHPAPPLFRRRLPPRRSPTRRRRAPSCPRPTCHPRPPRCRDRPRRVHRKRARARAESDPTANRLGRSIPTAIGRPSPSVWTGAD